MRVRSVVWIAAFVAASGLVAFYLAYRPRDAAETGRFGAAYAASRMKSGEVIGALGIAAAALMASFVLGGARRKTVRETAPDPAVSLIEAIPTDRMRETLAELRDALARIASSGEPDMISFVDLMVKGAVRVRASDVHLHPLESQTPISFRVQGVLEDVVTIPGEHHKQLVARVKVMAKLNLFKADRPQDGHFVIDTGEGPADVRVSVLPTNHGEKAVLRIANVGMQIPELDLLGMPPQVAAKLRALLTRPQGIVFLTGPTGSGKTTTIYSALAHIKRERGATTQIATIEDPIEFDVPFLTQTQVNAEVGLDFAKGLRSILRQDPNVIMVGEIRDAETAHIAVQAGLTGHQIVTTVHAESAAGAFNRLIEMGVEPFLLASASHASLSQRLVRALCRHCRRPADATADERARLQLHGLSGTGFWAAPGCKKCDQSGYLGRTAFFELLEVTTPIRELMNAKVPTSRIHEAAVAGGMRPLLLAGIDRARGGATSLREVFRVCG